MLQAAQVPIDPIKKSFLTPQEIYDICTELIYLA